MKIGLITFHFANNFGAALQTYALSGTIEEQTGNEVIIIDYRNWFIRFTDTVRLFPISKKIAEIISGCRTFRERMGRLDKFHRFRQANFNMSLRYRTYSQLKKNPPSCDAFVCGSDQIWNPIVTLGVNDAYFLNFAREGQRKISYAASLGTTHIKEKHREQMVKHLETFDAVSVRESEGIQILKENNRLEMEHLIDPVFLLGEEEWNNLAGEPIVKGKYILVYVMQDNDAVYEYACKAKELLHIPIVVISRYGYKAPGVDKVLIDVGPREFLSLFKHATYICTNSFHGLAYAVIFGKNFFIIPSNRFSARMNNLLKVLQIEMVSDIDENAVNALFYDKDKVQECITREREKAYSYLKKQLSGNVSENVCPKHQSETKWKAFMQFIKFSIVGISNTLVSYLINISTLLILRNAGLKYDYMIANVIAFVLSVLWSFYWNNRYVFKSRNQGKKEIPSALARTYISYAFTGIILNNVLAVFWIEVLGISKFISPLLNLPIKVPINFLMQKLWVYKEKI